MRRVLIVYTLKDLLQCEPYKFTRKFFEVKTCCLEGTLS